MGTPRRRFRHLNGDIGGQRAQAAEQATFTLRRVAGRHQQNHGFSYGTPQTNHQVTLVINTVAELIRQRLRQRYSQHEEQA